MSPRKSEGCFVVRNNGRLEYRFFYIDEYGQTATLQEIRNRCKHADVIS